MRASPRFRARPSPSADRPPTAGWRAASRADAPRPIRWRLQPGAGPSKAPIAIGGSTPRVSRLGELEPERRFAALGAILAGQTHPEAVGAGFSLGPFSISGDKRPEAVRFSFLARWRGTQWSTQPVA